MTAINFTEKEFDNLELVRRIVLWRLKTDGSWTHLDHIWDPNRVSGYVTFERPHLRNRFCVLANEVMWQLIMQGVITPGSNADNPSLPHFRITDYGQRVLKEGRFIPHDPTGYLEGLRAIAEDTVGDTAVSYVEEALCCFNAGCNVAAVLLLGVAAEAVLLNLCDVIGAALPAPEKKAFGKLKWVKEQHRWVSDKFEALPKSERKVLPESLGVHLSSVYELIRCQRNELGHPQEEPPAISRDDAFMYFTLFPKFIESIEAFARYWREAGGSAAA